MHVYEVNVSQWCFDSPKLVTKKDSSDWSLQFGRKNEERQKLDLPHPHPETVGTRIIKIHLYKGISINRAFVTLQMSLPVSMRHALAGPLRPFWHRASAWLKKWVTPRVFSV